MYYFDSMYWLFLIPGLLVSLLATLLLKYWNGKYGNIANSSGMSGAAAAAEINNQYGFDVNFEQSQSEGLSDHYDPRAHVVSLSRDVANKPSIAAVAIAAHEMGHVQQHKSGSFLMGIRMLLVPAVNIGTNVGYLFILAGLLIGIVGLAWVGVAFFSLGFLFSLCTLPVEIDASMRAMKMINKLQLLNASETSGAKKVLIAASLTYVAGLLASFGNLMYYVFRVSSLSSRRD